MNDKVYCAGRNNYGQFGNNTPISFNTCTTSFSPTYGPTGPADAYPFSAHAIGARVSCGIHRTTKKAHCWGNNSFINGGANTLRPTPIVGPDGTLLSSLDFKTISTNEDHVCALTPAGKAYCWGRNDKRQLGSASAAFSLLTPQEVVGPDGTVATALAFKEIDAAEYYTCAILGTP